MLDDNAWSKLLQGLNSSTKKGSLRWDVKDRRSSDGVSYPSLELMMSNLLNRPKVFTATTKSAIFELSTGDGFGRAPFELSVWEFRGSKTHPIGTLRSSTSVGLSQSLMLNKQLEELFRAVDTSTESGDEIVSRLLSELGED